MMTPPPAVPKSKVATFFASRGMFVVAAVALAGIAVHLVLRFAVHADGLKQNTPLWIVLGVGGAPLVYQLLRRVLKLQFGSDLLAGISIVTAVLLHQYLAGALVVLMLSGGEALESYAVRSASSVLRALAKRMPSIAHKRTGTEVVDVPLSEVAIGDMLALFPHDICPVDGVVTEGRGVMDESFLTGEPFQMSKTPGSDVISGAINGESALTIRATRPAADSRYAKIMEVMRRAEENKPNMRRLADRLGTWYTPLAVLIAIAAWAVSGDSTRFLAVLVVATPCPLLIAIPVAIIGAISLCARRGIIVKNPAVLETIATCTTAIFDKTGTLTYGRPRLTDQVLGAGNDADHDAKHILGLVASLERYSKHPLAHAILESAKAAGITLHDATEISEPPGEGMRGTVDGHVVTITSRGALGRKPVAGSDHLPPHAGGLECFVVIDDRYAATYRFRDEPRTEGVSFIKHLMPLHKFTRLMIVSGDRESEVRYLAEQVGITEVFAEKTPEEKVAIVKAEAAQARTLYVGDGINDAPALAQADIGLAMGTGTDVAIEASDITLIRGDLRSVPEAIALSKATMRTIKQNLFWAFVYNALGIPIAAGLLYPFTGWLLSPIIASAAMALSSVSVVLNSLRLSRTTPRP